MKYTQMRSFHAVAKAGSFTGAARDLNVSQPTVTEQVKELEATYGIAMGALDLRIGMRSTEIMGATDSADRSFGHLGWMDGLMVLGVNF